MKIVVCVKQVGELGEDVEFADDGRRLAADLLEPALNEWDGYATEEALRIKERAEDDAAEVVIVSVGDEEGEDAIRQCLAMGADRAIRIDGVDAPDPLSVAGALAEVIEQESPTLVLCGAQSSDAVQAATGTALAEYLGFAHVAVVKKLKWPANDALVVHRELEGGIVDVMDVDLPALLTIQSGINEPRYSTLRAIKRAEREEIDVRDAGELAPPSYRIRRMFVPPKTNGAESLGDDPKAVAARIKQIIEERLG